MRATFGAGSFGLGFGLARDTGLPIVTSVDGPAAAQAVPIGSSVRSINGDDVRGLGKDALLARILHAQRPITLVFAPRPKPTGGSPPPPAPSRLASRPLASPPPSPPPSPPRPPQDGEEEGGGAPPKRQEWQLVCRPVAGADGASSRSRSGRWSRRRWSPSRHASLDSPRKAGGGEGEEEEDSHGAGEESTATKPPPASHHRPARRRHDAGAEQQPLHSRTHGLCQSTFMTRGRGLPLPPPHAHHPCVHLCPRRRPHILLPILPAVRELLRF